jgi:hypothetical protein
LGTLKVETGASRTANNISVIGNIQAEGAKAVNVSASSVGGSIQIMQSGVAKIYKVGVKGDILFDSNARQAFQNTGGVTISFNTIDGNLQCKENKPTPTGRKNVVQGNKEDQCAGL